MNYPLTIRGMAARMSDTEKSPNGPRLEFKDFAILVAFLINLATIVWWAAKLTESVDNLTAVVGEVRTEAASLRSEQVDLRIRLTVQEVLQAQAERP